jgi:hypothetical protein
MLLTKNTLVTDVFFVVDLGKLVLPKNNSGKYRSLTELFFGITK